MKTLTLLGAMTFPSFRAPTRNPFLKTLPRLFAVFGLVMMFAVSGFAERDFTIRGASFSGFGDVNVTGNTVLCILSGGECVEPTDTDSNADTNLQKAPRSQAQMIMPADAVVYSARLYWQGRQSATNNSSTWSNAQKGSAKTIKFRKENGSWTTLTADVIDTDQTTSTIDNDINYVKVYSASANVTNIIAAGLSGSYEVDPSSFYTETGKTQTKTPKDGIGAYGAWVLVVVYSSNSSPAKNITIFDGYKIVQGGGNGTFGANVDFSVSGFYTPRAGAVNSTVHVFAGEGDKYLARVGDTVSMGGELFNTSYVQLGTMDSRVDIEGVRNPSLTNNNGIDIHKYNVGITNGTGALQIITNNETGAKFRFNSNQDTYFPSLLVFATDLFIPDICYDYAFSQNNRFFPHDASPTAHIHGYLTNTEPLSANIMFRNRGTGTEAKNLSIFFDDINSTNELEFYTDSTSLALQKTTPDSFYYFPVASGAITTNTIADLGFDWVTGTDRLGYNESVFTSFNLNPLVTGEIDVPLKMSISYDYELGTNTYSLSGLELDERIPRCVPAPTAYNPIEWIFNVVDASLNPGTIAEGRTDVKYNLATQVANRPTDIKVVSFNPTQLDEVKALNGMVAVELIDVSGYLDTESACDDPNSAVTQRAWLQLGDADHNVTSGILKESDFGVGLNYNLTATSFFKNIRENAAYRVSYNIADDNGSIKFDSQPDAQGNPTYQLFNFPSYAGQQCTAGFVPLTGNSIQIPTYCGNNANGNGGAAWMTAAELRSCLECVYGLKTKSVCSRDNFSIRPEGFNINIRDTNGSTLVPYNGNVSAGYMYRFDVNATNHIDNNATSGYSVWYNGSDPDRNVSLEWSPNGQDVTGCNDTTSPALQFYFTNGEIINQTREHSNVGRFKLSMRDKSWTTVDQLPMAHHNNSTNWDTTNNDCVVNEDMVPLYLNTNTYALNMVGCSVSSQHTKVSAPTAQFDDYNLSFRPYKFDISSLMMGTGTNYGGTINTAVSPAVPAANANQWTYISDLALGDQMGVRYSGNIVARGYNNATLSNFVDNCFAEPLDLNFSIVFPVTYTGLVNNATVAVETHFDYRLDVTTDANATDYNNTASTTAAPVGAQTHSYMILPTSAFIKDQNGSTSLNLTVNFDRNQTIPQDPIVLRMNDLQVKCSTGSDCTSNADGITNSSPDRTLVSDVNVTFAYGRVVPRGDINVFGFDPFVATAYYEVYNAPAIAGVTPSVVAPGVWFVNTAHNDVNHGNATISFIDPAAGSNMTLAGTTGYANGMETYNFTVPFTVRQGYKAHIDTDPWLWHLPFPSVPLPYLDPNGPLQAGADNLNCLTHPCFNIIFRRSIGNTGSAKTQSESDKNNKNSTTSGTWSTTREYAPSSR